MLYTGGASVALCTCAIPAAAIDFDPEPPPSNPARQLSVAGSVNAALPHCVFPFLFTFASILHDTVIMPVRVVCPSLGELHIHMLTEWRGCTTGEARAELQGRGALRTNRARIGGPHARTPGVVHLRVHGSHVHSSISISRVRLTRVDRVK